MPLNTPTRDYYLFISYESYVALSYLDSERLNQRFGNSWEIDYSGNGDPLLKKLSSNSDEFIERTHQLDMAALGIGRTAIPIDLSSQNISELINTEDKDMVKSFGLVDSLFDAIEDASDFIDDIGPYIKKRTSYASAPIDIKYKVKTTNNLYQKGSYFKIGPHIYGGEVQSVRIVEQKAISKVSGVRTNSDFLIDSGTGEADAEVILLFRDNHAIINHFIPLVALFKISPITSVKNKVINDTLLNEFTENDVTLPTELMAQGLKGVLEKSVLAIKRNILVQAFKANGVIVPTIITASWFNGIRDNWDPNNEVFTRWPNFTDFEEDTKVKVEEESFIFDNTEEDSQAASKDQQERGQTKMKSALTTHVPMAMMSLEVQSHPDLPEAILVKLILRRIDVENYLRGSLLYRTRHNRPTENPLHAYWLRRALDIYIDEYIDIDWVFGGEKNKGKGKIAMSFMGENTLLKLFADKNDIGSLVLNNPSDGLKEKATVVNQITYSIQNKFAFPRLAGKSYPTAQFMGASSGSISMSITTNDLEHYKKIHKYKSAADFFIRTADRVDRFNGWRIDSWLTRLFNNNLKPDEIDNNDIRYPSSAWYPMSVASSTNPNYPELRDINLGFAETNPDFFSDFGFTIKSKGYDIDELKIFYDEVLARALNFRNRIASTGFSELISSNDLAIDRYSYNLFFGDGTLANEFSIFNYNSIVAAFLEPYSATGVKDNSGLNAVQDKLISDLNNNSLFSGKIHGATSSTPVLDVVSNAVNNALDVLGDNQINEKTSVLLNKLFFIADSREPNRNWFNLNPNHPSPTIAVTPPLTLPTDLSPIINFIPNVSGRKRLYTHLWRNVEIGFTDLFKDRLFSALVQRRTPPFDDKLYDRLGVANGYNALVLGLEAKGHSILKSETYNMLSKTANVEAKIFISGNKHKSERATPTCYNDYPFITFGKLFEVPGNPDNWKKYAPKYNSLGIANNAYHQAHNGAGSQPVYDVEVAKASGSARATKEDGPIPPSIFFYREDELSSMLDNLEEEVDEWFDKVKQHRLDLPFDMERIVGDELKRNLGKRNPPANGGTGYATRIEEMTRQTRQKIGNERFKKAAGDIVLSMLRGWAKEKNISSEDVYSDPSLRDEFTVQMEHLVAGKLPRNTKLSASDSSITIIGGTALGQDIAKYKSLSGVTGDSISKEVLSQATAEGTNLSQFIDTTLTRSASGINGSTTISVANLDECKTGMIRSIQHVADNSNDLIKAFPVMRLYLIDYVGPRIIVQDNFYGYHAISSIDITLDKQDASLAVIKLADPFHVLQGSGFNNEIKSRKNKIGKTVLPASASDLEANDVLSRIALKQGRAVQIRGGHSANPENLDILFTGRIAEISFGEEVTIVCQGWKAELVGRQVSFQIVKNNTGNTSVKDLIVETIRHAAPAGMGDIYPTDQARKIYEIASTLSASQQIFNALTIGQGTNTVSNDVAAGFTMTPSIGPFSKTISTLGKGLDLRLKNIWVPDVDRKRWAYFGTVADTQWQGTGWNVPLQSAWETLEQATNYLWGYIVQVVPYDGEASLFFGRPDQMYFYTDGEKTEKSIKGKERKAETYRDLRIDIDNIFSEFCKSPQYVHHPSLSIEQANHFNRLQIYDSVFTGRIRGLEYTYFGGLNKDDIDDDIWIGPPFSWKTHEILSKANNSSDKFFSKMGEQDLYSCYKEIGRRLDDNKKASMLLLSKYYGLNMQFVNEQMNASELIRVLLGKGEIEKNTRVFLEETFGSQAQTRDFIVGNDSKSALSVNPIKIDEAVRTLQAITRTKQNYGWLSFKTEEVASRKAQAGKSGILTGNRRDTPGYTKSITIIAEEKLYPLQPPPGQMSAEELYQPILAYAHALGIKYFTVDVNSTGLQGSNENRSDLYRKDFPVVEGVGLVPEADHSSLADRWSSSYSYDDPTKVPSYKRRKQVRLWFTGIENKAQVILMQDFLDGYLINENMVVPLNTLLGIQGKLKHGTSNELINNRLAFNNEDSVLGKLGQIGGFAKDKSNADIADIIIKWAPLFKSFAYYMNEFLSVSNVPGSINESVRDSVSNLSASSKFEFEAAANMKVFRDYHYLRSGVDIIKNNLAASTREMFNSVVIRYPAHLETSNDSFFGNDNSFIGGFFTHDTTGIQISGETTWTSWPPDGEQGQVGMQFSPNIILQDKKVAVYTDLNATERDQCAKIATNVLTKNIRPMYRNNILILGRAIKPWDYVYLDDKFVDMNGPVEVERVVHHYNATTGWQTNIVPHAFCEANAGNSYMQAAIFNSKIDKWANISDYVLWGLTLATLGAGGVAGAGFKAASSTVLKLPFVSLKETLKFTLKKGVKDSFVGTTALAKTMGGQYKALGKLLGAQTPAALKALMVGPLSIGFAGGQISRHMLKNFGAGKEQLPVIFIPLQYKNIALEAGLGGEDVEYWSLSSRLHYANKDFQAGISAIYNDLFSATNPNGTYTSDAVNALASATTK